MEQFPSSELMEVYSAHAICNDLFSLSLASCFKVTKCSTTVFISAIEFVKDLFLKVFCFHNAPWSNMDIDLQTLENKEVKA